MKSHRSFTNVVLCANSGMLAGAMVAIYSTIRASSTKRIVFHIFCSGWLEKHKVMVEDVVALESPLVEVRYIDVDESRYSDFRGALGSRVKYVLFDIHDYIDCSEVIYIDCDVVVNVPIEE